MKCGACGHEHEGIVGFGAVCDHCAAWLHVCMNCRLFQPGANRCRSHTTETAGPRDAKNFCEEFVPRNGPEEKPVRSDAAERFNRLFRRGE